MCATPVSNTTVGADVIVGWTDDKICLIEAILAYLKHRNNGPGPFFVLHDATLDTCILAQELVEFNNIKFYQFLCYNTNIIDWLNVAY